MASKQTNVKSVHRVAKRSPGSTVISPQALYAWSRIPTYSKDEILATFKRTSPAAEADVQILKVGAQVLKVRRMSSGFRVVYESGDGRNTIVSVLTPREARLAQA